ncbi:peptide-methionine (S)-S-oxide reductase MsrA [Oricola cellulosilytica]|uniref:Peptide methionine sulfoxide reductase MsrA n=1 Tax=Oricola cellulosilytica TaxID=1429082 RepID=A0A4R0PH31_9HYPH|nr:peptide-methionine (S)-S-oxide reductase MsrA [Oricola cellulosilytica]TCD15910.1 peptide-methionine (S)-S-oxide reductase [Oricola cellulosilytica]
MIRSMISAAILAISAFSPPALAETKALVVAGGCFWCVESDFDHVRGVTGTTSGYAGGTMKNPTYRNHGKHREVVRIDYDGTVTDYRTLVSTFLRTMDPTDAGGQFCDRGRSYSSAIHAATDEERRIAQEEVARARKALGRDIATPVEGEATFYRAEDYHQNYYMSEVRQLTRFGLVTRARAYKSYRKACGRDARVKQLWGREAYTGVVRNGS